jgi:hypothetical protein
MALTKDSTGYYLKPSTGQYYTRYTAPVYSGYNQSGYMGMGGWQSQPNYGIGSMVNSLGGMTISAPKGLLTVDGKMYKPFTGNAAGISQGKRSVVDALVGGRQPYQYNVPSLSDMFPDMQGAMQQTVAMPQGNAGAGRFLGGLLGAMPTPVSTTTTQAPSSSGAGRYL